MQTCLACGSDSTRKDGSLEGYVKGKRYDIYSCASCNTKWSDPHTSSEGVYEYIYKHRADTPGYMRYELYAKDILTSRNPLGFLSKKEEMYYGVAKSLQKHVPSHGSVLDVGCGLGYMTYALSKAGYEATGLDISNEAITEAKSRFGNLFICQDFFMLDNAKYDAICMLELIEHVEDPNAYIAHAKKLLKPDGVLIITTPNRSWYAADALWESDLPPVHITWFSEEGLRAFALHNGYESQLLSYAPYNLLHGSILKPESPMSLRQPLFTGDGQPLFPKYTHSRVYHITRKVGVYHLLKGAQKYFLKLGELISVTWSPKRISFAQTHTICAVLRPK